MASSSEATPTCAVDVEVIDARTPCREHIRIEMRASDFPPSDPGQFLQVRCDDNGDDAPRLVEWNEGALPVLDDRAWRDEGGLLRRPFSIADRWDADDGAHLVVISRAVGRGTRWLEHVKTGDRLNITGPLGHGFRAPQAGQPCVLVGGGVGVPPMLYLARRLTELGHRDVTMVFGAMTRDLLPVTLTAEPDAAGAPRRCAALPGGAIYDTILTTDDGTLGLEGRVTDALELWRAGRSDAATPIVYACGPEPMLRALARQTRACGMECQLCIERMMGCGMGTCLSCVVRVHDASAEGGTRWALSCSEGPVFDRDVLVENAE